MADVTVIRGDSYALRRPIWTFDLADIMAAPFDLKGCTVMTTYKPTITSIESDGTDASAEIKHEIQIGPTGTILYQSGLFLVGDPEDGQLVERWTSAETLTLQAGSTLQMDLQLIDQNDEVFTWIYQDAISVIDGVTHRSPT